MTLNRIFMNEVDSSPGGGGILPAPDAVPTQGAAATPPSMSAEQVKAMFAEQMAEFRNGIFADLRKSGALKQEKPVENPSTPAAQKLPGAPAQASGLSVTDVESMLERERVTTRAATQHALSDAQVKHMKSALTGVSPEDYATAATSYLTDMGLVKATPPAASTVTTGTQVEVKTPPAAPNAPAKVDSITAQGLPNPWALTSDQIEQMSPDECRGMLEKLTVVGRARLGTPPVPKLPARK